MGGSERGNEVVFASPHATFGGAGAEVVGRDELNGGVAGEEELLDSTRFLVVEDELGEGVANVAEESEDEGEGGDVGFRGLVFLGGELDIALVDSYQNVVVSLAGLNGQTT